MKLTTKDVKVVDDPEFRMLNNRVGLFNLRIKISSGMEYQRHN